MCMYVYYSNRSFINRPTPFLQLKPHRHDDIRYCQYYDNGTKVLSCSSKETKVRLHPLATPINNYIIDCHIYTNNYLGTPTNNNFN